MKKFILLAALVTAFTLVGCKKKKADDTAATGSADMTGSAGSAAIAPTPTIGSDTGSAAMAGSDTGSAAMAGSAAGSDTGSAGSAAEGSADGSAKKM